MKLLVMISIALSLVGCHISRSFQPPPEGYEGFYKKRYDDTPPEVVKRDMLACGFNDVLNNASMLNNDLEGYTQSTICMEQLGYNTTDGRGKICSIKFFKYTEACQKHLAQ